tara:strand:+ start:201 stop:365 length:165 start_codon:yes stop_codon:yes gene_type:complete
MRTEKAPFIEITSLFGKRLERTKKRPGIEIPGRFCYSKWGLEAQFRPGFTPAFT